MLHCSKGHVATNRQSEDQPGRRSVSSGEMPRPEIGLAVMSDGIETQLNSTVLNRVKALLKEK